MEKFNKILAHIPHSSIQDYEYGWSGCGLMFCKVKELTDWHTNILFSLQNPNVRMMVFPHSRFFVDVERLLDDPLEASGQGILYTDYCGFKRNLTEEQSENLMEIYHKWHKSCALQVDKNTLVIDCHSFHSDDRDVDVCIGFNDDETKPSDEVLDMIRDEFGKIGLKVAYNTPYSNSIVFGSHESVMIEVRKDIYMDEETLCVVQPMVYKINGAIQTIYNKLLQE